MPFNPAFADAIANIESGGRYGILGPVTKSGDRAYGKYQVMGSNIPVWTKEVLGAPLSPQEFLSNPQAQDAVFQAKFGQYEAKFGPEGAAQAWFGGPGAVGKLDRKDQLGTTVGSYGQQFMAGLSPSAQPLDGPQQPPQRPLPPQPLNLAAPQQPTPAAPTAAGGPWKPYGSFQEPPPLSAPMAPALGHFNLAQAYSQIPLPRGFRGFSIG